MAPVNLRRIVAYSKEPARQPKWRELLSALGAVALMAAVFAGWSSTATAAGPTTFNPFDINRGFTVLATGNVNVNSSEIEGSVAALGSISSGNPNGFPVQHTVAGEPGYTVPTIDGTPVRILADRFIGSGSFDISNRDDSGTIAPGSPEANAAVKLANIAGLSGSARGGGVGDAAGQDFFRITNPDNGVLDLKTVPYAGSDLADFQTVQP